MERSGPLVSPSTNIYFLQQSQFIKQFDGNHLWEDGGYTLLVISVAGSADKNVLIVLWLHSRHTSRILAETNENSSGQY